MLRAIFTAAFESDTGISSDKPPIIKNAHVGALYIPKCEEYTLLGKGTIYPKGPKSARDILKTLLEQFAKNGFQLAPPETAHMGEMPDALTYTSPTMIALMQTQLKSVFSTPSQSDIDRMNKYRIERFVPILALVLTFNNACLPETMPATIFGKAEEEELDVTMSHKDLFYDILRREYYYNLDVVVTALTSLGVEVPWDLVNCSPCAAFRKIENVMTMLKRGVHSSWNDLAMSEQSQADKRKGEAGKTRGRGMFLSEFVFIWPLIIGTFKERNTVINASEMMSNETRDMFTNLCDELNLRDYPILDNESLWK